MQILLPLFPSELTLITPTLGFEEKNEFVYYFHSGVPIYTHPKSDLQAFRFITSNFVDRKMCTRRDIADAFKVSYDSVKKNVRRFQKQGEKAFFGKDSRHGHSYKLVGETLERVQSKLENNQSILSIAKQEGISEGSIRAAIKRGALKKNSAK